MERREIGIIRSQHVEHDLRGVLRGPARSLQSAEGKVRGVTQSRRLQVSLVHSIPIGKGIRRLKLVREQSRGCDIPQVVQSAAAVPAKELAVGSANQQR